MCDNLKPLNSEITPDTAAKENDKRTHQNNENVASNMAPSETTTSPPIQTMTSPPTTDEKEARDRHEELLDKHGSAAKFKALWQLHRENPDRDFAAEYEKRHDEHQENRLKALKERRDGKELFFFYGTLMDPVIAQGVLGLSEPPVLRPACIKNGGHLKMWGPYPALVHSKPWTDIKGFVCEIEGGDAKDRLTAYEGDKYEDLPCFVEIVGENDGPIGEDEEHKDIMAKVFEWIGGDEDLTDGVFDLEEYKLFKAQLRDGQV